MGKIKPQKERQERRGGGEAATRGHRDTYTKTHKHRHTYKKQKVNGRRGLRCGELMNGRGDGDMDGPKRSHFRESYGGEEAERDRHTDIQKVNAQMGERSGELMTGRDNGDMGRPERARL